VWTLTVKGVSIEQAVGAAAGGALSQSLRKDRLLRLHLQKLASICEQDIERENLCILQVATYKC
jgi:hypothetical protein